MSRLLRSAPYLPVADVDATVAYYESVLGFRAAYVAGEPAVFAIVGRDEQTLMFRRVEAPGLIRPSEAQGDTWDAFYWTDDADSLHAELLAAGAEIAYGPVIQDDYSMKEFAVRDPDGHVLGFGEDVAPPS
ncbi:MAG: hypothetical protein GKS06_19800 [Acidobacteria bacterium]|nr:hypothetical protein [Acidobacteriota bacterium]